jgi:hypothetical protein
MFQGPVRCLLIAMIVHHDHERDGHSSDDIEKDKPLRRLRHNLLRNNLR